MSIVRGNIIGLVNDNEDNDNLLNEDDFSSNSATMGATQQSIRNYVNNSLAGVVTVSGATDNTIVRMDGSDDIQDSGITISDADAMAGVASLQFSSGVAVTSVLDEDNMASNSATALATQQSIKAYVDAAGGGGGVSVSGTDNRLVRMNGTTGIQDSGISISDGDAMTGVASLQLGSGVAVTSILNETDLTSDSATALVTQSSIKSYVDASVSGSVSVSGTDNRLVRMNGTTGIQDSGISVSDADAMSGVASLQLGSGVAVTSILNDATLAGDSATALVTQSSVKSYIDTSISGTLSVSGTDNRLVRMNGTAGLQDTGISISDADAMTGVASLQLGSGVAVTSILNDATLAGNSATALVTQSSVKSYIDNVVPTLTSSADNLDPSSNLTWNGTTPIQFAGPVTLSAGTYLLLARATFIPNATHNAYLYISTANDVTAKNVGVRVASTGHAGLASGLTTLQLNYAAHAVVTIASSTSYYIMGNLTGVGTSVALDFSLGIIDAGGDHDALLTAIRIG